MDAALDALHHLLADEEPNVQILFTANAEQVLR